MFACRDSGCASCRACVYVSGEASSLLLVVDMDPFSP